ncbi:MAG: peptidylprolyl isomerase [Bacteroidales bacterium]|nr:peptidylprolyl isomerase [Bacteroidales bacterium]
MKRQSVIAVVLAMSACLTANAQKYNFVDKTVAVVGNEVVMVSDIENEIKNQLAQGFTSDRNMRCEILESILENKIFLMQARIDSLSVNQDNVESGVAQQSDRVLYMLGGEEQVQAYFGKPLYRMMQEWRTQYEEMSLISQEQGEIINKLPDTTPNEVRAYMDTVDVNSLPIVPVKYQLSQICLYPDREAANLAVREKLLELRERIINGEKFSTLARIYSDDIESARRGGELGMGSKSLYWPSFSDAAMSLRPGVISQIVETPDGFHLIEVIEKKGDKFNARHILIRPKYTEADREKAFKTLDSLRTEILNEAVSFQMAANFYSQDLASRTNGGQMSDPHTGSAYFEIDQLKPQDYRAIRNLKEGEISDPVKSTDNEGRESMEGRYMDGKENYKIIKVDRIIPSHAATFEEDYSLIQDAVTDQKQEKALDEFLQNKVKEVSIIIDPVFGECDFKRALWKEKIRKD